MAENPSVPGPRPAKVCFSPVPLLMWSAGVSLHGHSRTRSISAVPGPGRPPWGPLHVASQRTSRVRTRGPRVPLAGTQSHGPRDARGPRSSLAGAQGGDGGISCQALPRCLFLRTFVGRPGRRRCQESEDTDSDPGSTSHQLCVQHVTVPVFLINVVGDPTTRVTSAFLPLRISTQ